MKRDFILDETSQKNQARFIDPERPDWAAVSLSEVTPMRGGKAHTIAEQSRGGRLRESIPLTTHLGPNQGYTSQGSSSTYALMQTLAEVRSLRDEALANDPSSRGGLALAQLSLILVRLTRGIPARRSDFESIIRVCRGT